MSGDSPSYLRRTKDQQRGHDADLETQIVFVIALFVIFVMSYFYYKRKTNSVHRGLAPTDQRYEDVDEAAVIKLRRKDPGTRKQVIEQKIVRKKCTAQNIICTEGDSSVDTHSTQSLECASPSLTKNCRAQAARRETEEQDATCEANTCSVCLEPFSVGDEVAWSRELKCHHCFHPDCLIPWLMKHAGCPVCRSAILKKSDFIPTCDAANSDMGKNKNDEELCDDFDSSFEIRNGQVEFQKCSMFPVPAGIQKKITGEICEQSESSSDNHR
jgi:hypothetical protein